MKLPPPTTFAEGLRLLFAYAAIACGVAIGCAAVGLAAVFIWGGWPPALYGRIVEILGTALIGAIGLLGVCLVGMLLGGPVGRLKGSVSRDGASIEAEGE